MPDVDAVTWLGGPDAFQRYHQFYTHNLIAFALAPPLLALGVRRLAKTDPPIGRLLALCWGGMALHLLADTIAHWPLRLFWPFSREGISFEFIHRDFSVVLPFLLLTGTGLSFANELQQFRRAIAIGTLVAASLYVVLGPGW